MLDPMVSRRPVLDSRHLTPKEEPMSHVRPNRLRRAVVYVALAALLGVVSLTLSQCTLVGDSLTGVGFNKFNATNCIAQCTNLYGVLWQEETKLHLMNLELCGDGFGSQQCIDSENERHRLAQDALLQGKKDCKDSCHIQGGGTAG
jgi:hypothetical protein